MMKMSQIVNRLHRKNLQFLYGYSFINNYFRAKPKKTTTDDSSATVVKKSRKKPSEDTTKRPETPVVSKLLTDEKEPKEKKNTKASGKASASVQKESAE